jgi:ABC-2 type transport system permease protein
MSDTRRVTTTCRPSAPSMPDPGDGSSAAPRTSMLAATVRAEWTKLRTVPSTAWLLLAAVGCTVALSAGSAAGVSTDWCATPADCPADLPRISLTGFWLGQAVAAVLGTLAITNEYGTRMITTTLAVNPHRVTVLLTKAGVVTALVLGAGALAVAGSLLAGWAILPGQGFTAGSGYPTLSLADEPTLRAGAGTVLYFGLIALLSLGIGAIVRDTAGALATVLGLLYLFPFAAALVTDPQWSRWLNRYAPASGRWIQHTIGVDQLPISPWGGLGVLAGWAGAAMLIGTILFKTRDA